MKRLSYGAGLFALTATTALAGGIDRSGQSVGVIFESGNYAEFSFGLVSPDVSGVAVPLAGGAPSGDMAGNYAQFSGAYKHQFSDAVSAAIIVDQPFGADVDYPVGTGYYAAGATAKLKTLATTGVVKYTMPSNLSVYGGVRYQTLSAVVSVPFVAGYTGDGARDGSFGYLLGVAWEKPEIALRVALTYNSKIKHEIDTTENSLLGPLTSITTVETPKSVNLDFQSGVAKDTLVFGSVRWVDWSNFDITPAQYQGITGGSLVSYANDTVSYTLGVGRRFNDHWSGAVTLGYEGAHGGFASNLGPTDGYRSIGLGATYTQDNMKITGGVRYVSIGKAQTQLGAIAPAANFTDNSGIGVGLKLGFSF
ncbi:MAG: outer membrane protein transport protein [Defluviimonas sp.]|uniref:OmpP1/FadL family transporter n=1 Tax=Albidovulum sp. TaxID=1872424 RepID=UPI001D8AE63E|nr:outer membrane protein transport protein [Paracoccaceae bacterium]MCC0063986.1 outer membrane protein transport protein [Defluviimonas sp.]